MSDQFIEFRNTQCFEDAIGSGGLAKADYERYLAKAAPALDQLRAWHEDGSLPLLRLPARRDDLKMLEPVVDRFRTSCDDVLLLGTGGSSLGGQTINALADQGWGPPEGTPRLHFMDNVDPVSFEALFRTLDPGRTGMIAISKSGGTAETLTQFTICHDTLTEGGTQTGALIGIVEPQGGVLREFCAERHIPVLDHDPKVGGRYSALSLVGLLPAMIAGIDVVAVREGAASILDPTLAASDPSASAPAIGAAISIALAETKGVSQTVLMPYSDRLGDFGLWFRQLWAESLGKGGKGTTPIRAVGTVDQHSQVQLYLDGPKDKLFTFITSDCAGRGARLPADEGRLGPLAGRTMGDVLDACQRATAETLAGHGRPVRVMHLAEVDAASMGAMMMHFMLETIIAAHLLGVDPFDQPAVEDGKVLARKYLEEMGSGA